jgi:hypothetical protein
MIPEPNGQFPGRVGSSDVGGSDDRGRGKRGLGKQSSPGHA